MRAPSTSANSSSILGEAEDGISSVRWEFTEFFRAYADNFSGHATFSLNDIASVASVNGGLRLPDFFTPRVAASDPEICAEREFPCRRVAPAAGREAGNALRCRVCC